MMPNLRDLQVFTGSLVNFEVFAATAPEHLHHTKLS